MDKDSSKNNVSQQLEDQSNKIAYLENELKKQSDPNAEPRIIQRGKQQHPKYQRNKIKVEATLPKEQLVKADK